MKGVDSGECRAMTKELRAEMPFCGEVIEYQVCVPKQHQDLQQNQDRNEATYRDSLIESNHPIPVSDTLALKEYLEPL